MADGIRFRGVKLLISIAFGGALLGGCAAQPAASDATPAQQQSSESSILVSSTPAAGSTVAAPVNELKLRFSPPARLDEVTVTGPDGTMPMMVHAVGETADYSLPLSGLDRGSYSVNWKATAAGRAYRGSFSFTAQ